MALQRLHDLTHCRLFKQNRCEIMKVNLDSHVQEKAFDCLSIAMMRLRASPSKSIMVILKDLLILASTSPSEA